MVRKMHYVAVGVGMMILAGCSSPSTPPSASTSPSGTGGGASAEGPTAAPEPSATPVEGQCVSDGLAPSIQSSADDTGTRTLTIALTNISTTASCTLQGWPGVSFVEGGDGTQLGAAAEQDPDSPNDTVTLNADGGAATFTVVIRPYAEQECDPRDADGIRIYPPGETQALFIDGAGQDLVGCASESAALLTTGAVRPGG